MTSQKRCVSQCEAIVILEAIVKLRGRLDNAIEQQHGKRGRMSWRTDFGIVAWAFGGLACTKLALGQDIAAILLPFWATCHVA